MADEPKMTPKDWDDFFVTEYLGLPADTNLVDVTDKMRLFKKAQDDINKAAYHGESLPEGEIATKLVEMSKTADATIFWHLFYQYDSRHDLGFREDGLRNIKIVGGF